MLLDGIDQSRARVLHDTKWDIVVQSGVLVRVVGSPWTCYDSKNKQHITGSHHWRPRGGTIYGGDKLPLTDSLRKKPGVSGDRLEEEKHCLKLADYYDRWMRVERVAI